MKNYRLGDKVAYKTNPYECIGKAVGKILPNSIIIVTNDYEFIIEPEDSIVAYEKEIDMSDDEIFNMLKPKMKNNNVWNHGYRAVAYDDGYHLVREDNDVIKAIALAYRSGYLRAKKGRPFKIGGEKD